MKRKPKIGQPHEGGDSNRERGAHPLWFVGRFLAVLAVGQVAIAWFPSIESLAVRSTLGSLQFVVRSLGLPGGVDGTSFHLGQSSVHIVGECTPLMPTLVLASAIVAYPARWRIQLLGLLVGAAMIWAFNLVRIATLAAILGWRPASFDFIHMYLWQTVTLFVVLLIFMLWLRFQRPSVVTP